MDKVNIQKTIIKINLQGLVVWNIVIQSLIKILIMTIVAVPNLKKIEFLLEKVSYSIFAFGC